VRRSSTLVGLTALVLAYPGIAGATGVAPAPKKVGAAFTSVSSCGSLSGIGMSWTSTANVVTTIVLTAIPAACIGGSLSLTLVGASGTSLGTVGPVVLTATSQTFSTITGSPPATSVLGSYISVVGP
jgi:hypothetical protein